MELLFKKSKDEKKICTFYVAEYGRTIIKLYKLYILAKTYGFSIDKLLGKYNDPEED